MPLKRILLNSIVLLLLSLKLSFGQSSFVIGIEPSTLLNTIDFDPVYDNLNIDGKRGLCFSLHLAYQKNITKSLFFNVGTRIMFLNSKIDLNLEQNGFNEQSQIYYDDVSDRNTTDYYSGAGVIVQLGYDMSINRKSAFSIVTAIHADIPIVPTTENSIFFNTGSASSLVYYDNLTSQESYQTVYVGFDLSLRYNLIVSKKLTLFAGPTVSMFPGQLISGWFQVYPSIPAADNHGSFSLNPSYVGLALGMRLSK